MSWDIVLAIDTGDRDLTRIWETNMTYNVSSMYYDALEIENGLRGLHKKRAGDAVMILRRAVAKMELSPDKYRAMEPDNKWGTYEQALDALKDIIIACSTHPKAMLLIE